ncbi:MAG: glucose/arabinose dehydrogenase [Yoonia sp.]|jgi:glucose/arabinose dehydrogenase
MLRFVLCLLPTFVLAEVPQGPPNADFSPAFAAQTRADALPTTNVRVETFATGLENPWGIASLGNGQFVVTERPGRMRLLNADGTLSNPLTGVPDVWDRGQGGLLDIAASPNFSSDRLIFWTYAKPVSGGAATAAARANLGADGRLSDVRDIFVQDPASGSQQHFGSRIVPMLDGTVWITTGDRGAGDSGTLVQDDTTTHGKVVRVNYDGSVPAGQDGIVWSKGHRNMQGAAVRGNELWTIEHGPRGGDELNQPQQGRNYGWPLVSYGVNYNGSSVGTGAASMGGVTEPVYYWDPVIAPGGMVFYDGPFADWRGDLLIGSLNPGALVRLKMSGRRVVGEERLLTDVGRVRDVLQAPDGALLILVDADHGSVLRVTPNE